MVKQQKEQKPQVAKVSIKKDSKTATLAKTVAKSEKSKKSIGTKQAQRKRQLSRRFNKLKVKAGDLDKKAIIYVGHLPRGFNEKELKKFFEQFGDVTRMRVARSKKTARPKGYAYLEFQDKNVAQTAAKTMQGYILFGRQLDCHVVEQPHRETFKNGNRDWKYIPTPVKFRNEKNREKTNEEKAAKVKGLLQKEKEKRDRLKELGIKYDFTGYTGIVEAFKTALHKEAKEQVKQEQQVSNKKKAKSKLSLNSGIKISNQLQKNSSDINTSQSKPPINAFLAHIQSKKTHSMKQLDSQLPAVISSRSNNDFIQTNQVQKYQIAGKKKKQQSVNYWKNKQIDNKVVMTDFKTLENNKSIKFKTQMRELKIDFRDKINLITEGGYSTESLEINANTDNGLQSSIFNTRDSRLEQKYANFKDDQDIGVGSGLAFEESTIEAGENNYEENHPYQRVNFKIKEEDHDDQRGIGVLYNIVKDYKISNQFASDHEKQKLIQDLILRKKSMQNFANREIDTGDTGSNNKRNLNKNTKIQDKSLKTLLAYQDSNISISDLQYKQRQPYQNSITTNNTPFNQDKNLEFYDLGHIRMTSGIPIHNSMINYKIKEQLQNKEDMKITRERLKQINEKLQNHKFKDMMRYILHKGYWKYKSKHFKNYNQEEIQIESQRSNPSEEVLKINEEVKKLEDNHRLYKDSSLPVIRQLVLRKEGDVIGSLERKQKLMLKNMNYQNSPYWQKVDSGFNTLKP
ncbi:UNKNOWN [Stylonychia lemnae]|uniref:RRM domain-containing protein n=1 Tax=Stylonychia lemnae TaxID=5949 RepID=A0A078B0N4_STYLE|nr:UNKNOWN [Stylonychia lemnae]|eukprot:CDW88104.1 UNKNOWN [Stylonychia lemnae]